MFYDLENRLVVGVSSRALFDLTCENEIFEKDPVCWPLSGAVRQHGRPRVRGVLLGLAGRY